MSHGPIPRLFNGELMPFLAFLVRNLGKAASVLEPYVDEDLQTVRGDVAKEDASVWP